MSGRLLDKETHNPTEVLEVLEALQKDPKAFYNPETNIRKVPIFEYDAETDEPIAIKRWQERRVIPASANITRKELLDRCQNEGCDTYIPGRGWIRNGKKAEIDANDLERLSHA